jgi:hypothetical protein
VCGFDVCEGEADLDRETAREIRSALWPLARPTAPFTKSLKKADAISVEPRFDADIACAEKHLSFGSIAIDWRCP